MEVAKQGGPIRARYCDKCDLLFSFSNEELAIAESVGTADSVALPRPSINAASA
jgi:hypothetical protein